MQYPADPSSSAARPPYDEQSWQGPGFGGPRGTPPNQPRPRRGGFFGWWIDRTAPPVPSRPGAVSIAERERLRKAELTSISILAIMAFLLALLSNSLADPSTGQAVATMAVVLVIAILLNRAPRATSWRTRVAAYMVPGIMMLLIMAAILQAGGGLRLIWLPAYDLLALPIFISSLIIDRRAPWIFGLVAITFIALDFNLQGHVLITAPGATRFDDIAYETAIWTPWGMINRHIALCLFAAFFGWLGARSVDGALARADRAEEVARLEHAVAEQRRALEEGVQQLLQTHVRLANGEFSARVQPMRDPLLWQVGVSLNNLAGRVQNASKSDFDKRRLEEEVGHLYAALADAKAGRPPVWPAPTGTVVDAVVALLSGRPAPAAAPPSRPQAQGMPNAPYSPAPTPPRPSAQWQSTVDPWQTGFGPGGVGGMPEGGRGFSDSPPESDAWRGR
jgi:hypothetical protein